MNETVFTLYSHCDTSAFTSNQGYIGWDPGVSTLRLAMPLSRWWSKLRLASIDESLFFHVHCMFHEVWMLS